MLKTLGIVEACGGSPRFCCNLRRRLAGRSLLEWVARRVTDSARLDGVIVLARAEPEQHFLRELVPADVPVFFSDQPHALGRLLRALEEYQAEAAVRVRGDNPFIDPALIDRLVATAESHAECDYASFCCRDGRPAILTPVGVYAEWFRTAALRRAARGKLSTADRELVTCYFHAHPEEFQLRFIPAPPQIDRDDVRLTIDMEEDWDHALAIFEALGPERLDWQRIADLLDHQPALRRRMAALNRVQCPG